MSARFRAWLRRSRWALLALVVLVPSAAWLALSIDYFGYQASQSVEAVHVERGESAEYGSARFSLHELEIVAAGSAEALEYEVPPGADLVVARLRVEPPGALGEDEASSCEIELVVPGDPERRWEEGASETAFPTDFTPERYCFLDEPEPYELVQLYLVPTGAAEGAVLEVSVRDRLPRVLWLH